MSLRRCVRIARRTVDLLETSSFSATCRRLGKVSDLLLGGLEQPYGRKVLHKLPHADGRDARAIHLLCEPLGEIRVI